MAAPTKFNSIDIKQFKIDHPGVLDLIKREYAPIFDRQAAIYLWLNGMPPPTCNHCGVRLTVSNSLPTACHKCRKRDARMTHAQLVSKMPTDNLFPVIPYDGDRNTSDTCDRLCSIHGVFSQNIRSAIVGNGCSRCYYDRMKGRRKYSTEEWVAICTAVHRGRYQYESSIYTGAESLVMINCRDHGIFSQQANVHMNGSICPKCSATRSSDRSRRSLEDFIRLSQEAHPNKKYDYSQVKYTGSRGAVEIGCPIHGTFAQVAYYHLAGNGCPKCGLEMCTYKSKPEYELLDYIKEMGVSDVVHSDHHLPFELDIYVPSIKIAIEYNGMYWHSSGHRDNDRIRSTQHLNKTNMCERNSIQLFQIFQNEWLDPVRKDIWRSILSNAIGRSTRIYARKCEIRLVPAAVAKEFCTQHHIQGHASHSEAYGLYYHGDLVAIVTIGSARYTRSAGIELIRFCNAKYTCVVGGFSKLIAYVRRMHPDSDIVSYANRRWSQGHVYENNGFVLQHASAPCYFYVKGSSMHHRSSFTKKKAMARFPNSNPLDSEADIMYDNGYRRIWDSGNKVYVLPATTKDKGSQ